MVVCGFFCNCDAIVSSLIRINNLATAGSIQCSAPTAMVATIARYKSTHRHKKDTYCRLSRATHKTPRYQIRRGSAIRHLIVVEGVVGTIASDLEASLQH